MHIQESITTKELRSVAVLAGIGALRMLGLCLILPVFALAAPNYTAATPHTIGMAIGVYGLLQAGLQLPYGMLSDRFGRKPLILLGLSCILAGSVICACATSIYTIILGRAFQGAGAMGSVVMATLVDQTRESVRSRAMAMVGASMGLAFAAALVLGPWLQQAYGLVGIFSLTAALAVCGMLLLALIPKAKNAVVGDNVSQGARNVYVSSRAAHSADPGSERNMTLPLYVGALILHANLAALFLVLPLLLQKVVTANVWMMYVTALLVAMLAAWQALKYAERRNYVAQLQKIAIAGLALGTLLLGIMSSWQALLVCLTLYFTAFCVLEASMPSLVAKYAGNSRRGAALGMYTTLQFIGVFVGGMLGGWLHGEFGVVTVISFCVSLTIVWLIFSVNNARIRSWQEA